MLALRTQPNLRLQFGLAVCPLAQEELVTASLRHSERFPHTYASAALCRTPPFGIVGVALGHSWDTPGTLLGHSREFPTFSAETSRGCISLTRYLIGVFFNLLESSSFCLSSGIRHTPFQHQKVFLCYFSVSDPVVNFQRN